MSETPDPAGARRPTRRIPVLGAILCGVAGFLWLRDDGDTAVAALLAEQGVAVPDPHALIAAGTALAAVIGWAALYLCWGQGGWLDRRAVRSDGIRRPLSYADIGPPPPREQPLPTDLDQPLSAYDPDALLPGVRRRS